MIDRATVERIKERADIVEVVSEFVTLRKSGANYKGLCPFHNEKTPSFIVSPARGTCHCFGCGKGGNAVGFIMEHEQLTYPEALRWLAAKYGIEVVEKEMSDRERQEQSMRESMFIVNEWAAGYFRELLLSSEDGAAVGMQYFRSRGFRDDIMERYRLGYDQSDRRALAAKAKKEGYREDFLLKTGICYRNDRGELIDRYAGRVIFPWTGISGKVTGFSARLLDARTKGVNQKYVNSPDSEIFHKEKELFGIWQAKKAIAKEDRVYIVEGQTDVLSMAQCGIENVVANSGTALSQHQTNILHRFTANITLLYDGDAAGIHAAMRGTDMLLAEGMNVKVLPLPDGEDPDSFARGRTADEFRRYVEENQLDFIQFKTRFLLSGASDPQKRSEAVDSIVASISVVPNQVLRDTYLHDAAASTGVKEATLIARMNGMIRQRRQGTRPGAPAPAPAPVSGETGRRAIIERMIARMVVREGGLTAVTDAADEQGNPVSLTVAEFIYYNMDADGLSLENPVYRKILETAALHERTGEFSSEQLLVNHEDIDMARTAMELSVDKYAGAAAESGPVLPQGRETERRRDTAEHLMLDFRKLYVEDKIAGTRRAMSAPGLGAEEKTELLKEYQRLLAMRNSLARRVGLNVC